MTPDETRELLALISALWPNHQMNENTGDAWAMALVSIDFGIARSAVLNHAQSIDGRWPPAVADITAAMRASQRDTRQVDPTIATIRAHVDVAGRDNANHHQRVARLEALHPDQRAALLGEATKQLRNETNSPVIPTRLAEIRATEILEAR